MAPRPHPPCTELRGVILWQISEVQRGHLWVHVYVYAAVAQPRIKELWTLRSDRSLETLSGIVIIAARVMSISGRHGDINPISYEGLKPSRIESVAEEHLLVASEETA